MIIPNFTWTALANGKNIAIGPVLQLNSIKSPSNIAMIMNYVLRR